MKTRVTIFIFLIVPLACYSQTRIYLSAGTNYNTDYFQEDIFVIGKGGQIYLTDGTYQSKKFRSYFVSDLLVEKRIVSGLYGLTGLSFFQTGHSNYLDDGPTLGVRTTDMTTSYLGIPLIVRD